MTTSRTKSAAPRKDAKTGTWYFVVDAGVKPDGRRRQVFRRGFRTKAEAQEALDGIRVDSRKGTFVPPKRITVGEYLEEQWLPTLRRRLATTTLESYERNVRLHIAPALGRIQLQALDAATINSFYSALLASGRKRGQQQPGLKARTARYIGTILHGALRDAVKWKLIPLNPADQADPPSAKAARSPEMRCWSQEELRRFLERCQGDRYYWPFLFLAMTGCRRGEALGVRWSDIDLDAGTATIQQTVIPVTKEGGVGREGRVVSRTKSEEGRTIELGAVLVAALKTWRAQQAAERLLLGPGFTDHGLVFARPDGRPYHPEQFSKTFDRRLCQAAFADLPTIRLHDLRHTWATLALVAHIDVQIVSKRLGHSSPNVTWQIYQHVVKGMQGDAADKVASLIFGR